MKCIMVKHAHVRSKDLPQGRHVRAGCVQSAQEEKDRYDWLK